MMMECPVGIVETWTSPLPIELNAMETYDVGFSLQLDSTKFAHISKVCALGERRYKTLVRVTHGNARWKSQHGD